MAKKQSDKKDLVDNQDSNPPFKGDEGGIDLERELEDETEEAQTEEDFEEPDDFPTPEDIDDNDDFDHEMITPDEEEDDDDGAYRDDPEFTKDYFHKTAHRWVKAFNALQKSILRRSYKKSILQKGDAEKAKEWQRKKAQTNAKFEDIVDGDWEVQERLERYMKAVEELPFTKDEAEDIAAPLAELVEKYRHLRMSPEMALIVAVTIAMLPRLEPIFPNVNDWFSKIFNKGGSQ